MELLIEQLNPSEGNIITETKADKTGTIWLYGTFMQADIKNRNGRTYPLSEMVNAVSEATTQIKNHGGIFGELDHPQSLSINMDRISHVITDLKIDGSNIIGKAKLLKTPMGLIAEELSKSGARYGVSSRGAGNVKDGGVVEGFKLITVDLVATPSAPGAMPSTIYEALDSKIGRKVLTLAEAVKNDPDAQKFFKKEISTFFKQFFT